MDTTSDLAELGTLQEAGTETADCANSRVFVLFWSMFCFM